MTDSTIFQDTHESSSLSGARISNGQRVSTLTLGSSGVVQVPQAVPALSTSSWRTHHKAIVDEAEGKLHISLQGTPEHLAMVLYNRVIGRVFNFHDNLPVHVVCHA